MKELDMKQYRLEHLSLSESEQDEITIRLMQKKAEEFWLLRHVKHPTQNVLLVELPEEDRVKIMSYFLLKGFQLSREQTKILDGNAEYIGVCESTIYQLKDIISEQTEIGSLSDLWEECPKCGDSNRFIKSGFCISCNAVVEGEVALFMCGESTCKTGLNISHGCEDCEFNLDNKGKTIPPLSEDDEKKLDDMIDNEIEAKRLEKDE